MNACQRICNTIPLSTLLWLCPIIGECMSTYLQHYTSEYISMAVPYYRWVHVNVFATSHLEWLYRTYIKWMIYFVCIHMFHCCRPLSTLVSLCQTLDECMCDCVCVYCAWWMCVCVWERERERESLCMCVYVLSVIFSACMQIVLCSRIYAHTHTYTYRCKRTAAVFPSWSSSRPFHKCWNIWQGKFVYSGPAVA